MKRIFNLACFFGLLINANSQTPQALNYQAVARTNNGVIIPIQNIGVRFSVLDGSTSGAVLYQETHQAQTNSYGLFTLSIGKGTPVTGTFIGINWASGTDKFLKVEIASAGGTNYLLQGTSQLLSVPYALYSEKTRLLAGNNTITITNGNTITGNYQPANNTVLINGNTIAGNYQPGIGIGISSNTISHNLVAGTGINITGNTISNTISNQWINDANGIHNQSGNVGIGTNSVSGAMLNVKQVATGGFSGTMDLTSDDNWHTVFNFRNTTVNQQWQFMVGGSTNPYQRPGTLAIFNTTTLRWPFYINPSNEYIGIGSNSAVMPTPGSRLQIYNGDINIDQIGSGIILKSPNGNCWRVTIDNSGNLIRTAITCL